MSPLPAIALILASAALAWAVTRWLVDALAKKGVLDRPNARSSHTAPTPRGGGWGILAGVVPAWGVIAAATGVGQGFGGMGLALGLALLVFVSWRDDNGGLPWRVRLAAQMLAVLLGLGLFAHHLLYAPSAGAMLAGAAALGIAVIVWVGFLNAFNFMDGIDGIAAAQAIAVAVGAALVFWLLKAHPAYILAALTLAAASLGFLVWNKAPARIFLGDVGSVPLGYLLGALLLLLADHGAWGAALALPAYFGADTVLTMIRRWRRGEKLTEAHRSHAYQRASGSDKARHALVVRRIALTNGAIIVAAVLGIVVGGPLGQVLTVVVAAGLIVHLLADLERMSADRAAGAAP